MSAKPVGCFGSGRVYATNMMLRNSANSIPVALNPGANLVKIHGIRDGAGGITLATQASNQGNMTNAPFPVGKVAMFYLLRRFLAAFSST